MNRIRLVVVDDHALFRAGLISLLNEMGGFQVVGEADNGLSAVDLILRTRPDVVLLDVNMPVMSGVDTVRALRKSSGHDCQNEKGSASGRTPSPKILMLTISRSEEDLFGAISAGADGYLLKNAEPQELQKAILNVYEGMSVLSPQVTRQVLRALSSDPARPDSGLSTREMEVLVCLAQGKTTLQIGAELYISENTVKTHVRHILEKLEASNRAEAVSKATQMGLLQRGN